MNPESITGARGHFFLASVADTDILANTPVRSDAEAKIPCRGVYVGGGGHLTLSLANKPDSFVTYYNLAEGAFYPFQITKVQASGSTATNLVFLW